MAPLRVMACNGTHYLKFADEWVTLEHRGEEVETSGKIVEGVELSRELAAMVLVWLTRYLHIGDYGNHIY